jgi:hypothetical protein
MKNLLKTIFVLLTLSLSFTSCQKEEIKVVDSTEVKLIFYNLYGENAAIQLSYDYTNTKGQRVSVISSGIMTSDAYVGALNEQYNNIDDNNSDVFLIANISYEIGSITTGHLILSDVDWTKPFSISTPLKTEYIWYNDQYYTQQTTFDGKFEIYKDDELINSQNIENSMWFFNNF